MLTTVVFDLGETLVDETSLWEGWARWLGVPTFTLYGVIGGLAARDQDHQLFLEAFRPGQDPDALLAAKVRDVPWGLTAADLYPDAVPTLQALKDAGWRVVVGGNQPKAFQQLVQELGLPVDLVTSSGELGVAKPAAEFYRALAARADVTVQECVHVGDRVDNDIVGAQRAGLTAVHVVRGPWGFLHAADAAIQHQIPDLTALPELLEDLR